MRWRTVVSLLLHTDAALHTMTKIPGEVRFTMDYRSYDENVLVACQRELAEHARRIGSERGVTIDLGSHTHAAGAVMAPELVALGRRIARRLGIDAPDMASGAGTIARCSPTKACPAR